MATPPKKVRVAGSSCFRSSDRLQLCPARKVPPALRTCLVTMRSVCWSAEVSVRQRMPCFSSQREMAACLRLRSLVMFTTATSSQRVSHGAGQRNICTAAPGRNVVVHNLVCIINTIAPQRCTLQSHHQGSKPRTPYPRCRARASSSGPASRARPWR